MKFVKIVIDHTLNEIDMLCVLVKIDMYLIKIEINVYLKMLVVRNLTDLIQCLKVTINVNVRSDMFGTKIEINV